VMSMKYARTRTNRLTNLLACHMHRLVLYSSGRHEQRTLSAKPEIRELYQIPRSTFIHCQSAKDLTYPGADRRRS
jgi:hypothetical protein